MASGAFFFNSSFRAGSDGSLFLLPTGLPRLLIPSGFEAKPFLDLSSDINFSMVALAIFTDDCSELRNAVARDRSPP